jgi:CHASE2 domain-containing sensor protein
MTLLAEQVLDQNAVHLPPNIFRDRIVLVGGDFPDRDQHLTPLSITNSQRYSGVSIHAQILAQLLDRRSIGPPALPLQLLILVIAACGGIWVGRRDPRGRYLFWIRSVGALGLIIVATVAFTFFGLIFPISLTLLFLLAGTTFGYHSGSPFLRK